MHGRRQLLKGAIALGLFAQEDPASVRPKEGDLLVKSSGAGGTPLTPDDISAGAAPTPAWAMDPRDQTVRSGSRLNQLLLVRLDVEKLAPDTRARAAAGVVAYTAICTHNGCDIDDWLASEQLFSCSCHASSFDPKDGGKVIEGVGSPGTELEFAL